MSTPSCDGPPVPAPEGELAPSPRRRPPKKSPRRPREADGVQEALAGLAAKLAALEETQHAVVALLRANSTSLEGLGHALAALQPDAKARAAAPAGGPREHSGLHVPQPARRASLVASDDGDLLVLSPGMGRALSPPPSHRASLAGVAGRARLTNLSHARWLERRGTGDPRARPPWDGGGPEAGPADRGAGGSARQARPKAVHIGGVVATDPADTDSDGSLEGSAEPPPGDAQAPDPPGPPLPDDEELPSRQTSSVLLQPGSNAAPGPEMEEDDDGSAAPATKSRADPVACAPLRRVVLPDARWKQVSTSTSACAFSSALGSSSTSTFTCPPPQPLPSP